MSFQAMSWAVKQSTPDPQSKLLLLMLANHSGRHETDHDICWPSMKLLAEECCMSEDTVARRIVVLRDKGLLQVTGRASPDGKTTSNLYKLPVPDSYYELAPAGSGGSTRQQRGSPPPAAGQTYNTNLPSEPKKRSVWETKTVMEAKQRLADSLVARHRKTVSTGNIWDDDVRRAEYLQLKREINELTKQLAGM